MPSEMPVASHIELHVLVDSGATTSSLDTPLLSFGHCRGQSINNQEIDERREETRTLGNVAVESVNDDRNVRSHG